MALTSADVDRILKEGQAQAGKNPWRPSRPYDIGLKAENLHNAGFPGMGIPEQKLGNWWWTDRNKTQFAYWGQTKDGDWTQHHDTTEPLYGPSWQASAALQAPRLQEQIEREAAAPPGTPPVVDAEVPDPERTPSDVGVVGDPQVVSETGRPELTEEQYKQLLADQAKIKYRQIPEGFVRPDARNGGSGPAAVNGGAPNGRAGGNGATTPVSPAEQSALDWAAGLNPTNAPGGTPSAPATLMGGDLSDLLQLSGGQTTVGGTRWGDRGRSTLLPTQSLNIGAGGYPGGIQRIPPTGGQPLSAVLPPFRGGGGYPGGVLSVPPSGGAVAGLRSEPSGVVQRWPWSYPGGIQHAPPTGGAVPMAGGTWEPTVWGAFQNAYSRDPYGIRRATRPQNPLAGGPVRDWTQTTPTAGRVIADPGNVVPWMPSGRASNLDTPYTLWGALQNAYSRDPYGIRRANRPQNPQAGGPVRSYDARQISPGGPQWWQW